MSDESVPVDSFGNPIDPEVAYARGSILRTSVEEVQRFRNAQKVAGVRVRELGPGSIGVFTGNPRSFPIGMDDLDTICEEWVGPSLYADDLKDAIHQRYGVPLDSITTGCGSDDVLDSAFRAAGPEGGTVRFAGPTFSMIEPLALMNGRQAVEVGV